MENQVFSGDKKLPMKSLLAAYERRFIDSNVQRLPKWIETYDLTLMTIHWSIGLILFGWLARSNLHWLWLSSLMLAMQWLTDSFDGAVGRLRKTGLKKWGFYMDHFLDFVFMSSLLIGYSFILNGAAKEIMFFFIPVAGCFMVSSYLAFGATNEFKITFLGAGPTEMRLYFIFLNLLIIIFGTGWLEKIIVYVFALTLIVMGIVVYRTQKYIWNIDMADKSAPDQTQQETT